MGVIRTTILTIKSNFYPSMARVVSLMERSLQKWFLGMIFFVPFSIGTGLDVNVITYSENDTEREWFIRYRGVDVIDSKGLELWVRNWYGKQIAIEMRRESGFWNYLFGLFWTKKYSNLWLVT